jgi:tocopherol O-methyltransferase
MIDRSLEWAYGEGASTGTEASEQERLPGRKKLDAAFARMRAFVDVGCGVGGSSRHIARRCGRKDVKGVGISLSPYQVMRANEFTATAGLSDNVQFRVADAMNMPFADNSFDLGKQLLFYFYSYFYVHIVIVSVALYVHLPLCAPSHLFCCVTHLRILHTAAWSMESGEHMPDKRQFMRELFRVTAPGGRILVVTWCHRELRPDEQSLSPKEQRLLANINKGTIRCASLHYAV